MPTSETGAGAIAGVAAFGVVAEVTVEAGDPFGFKLLDGLGIPPSPEPVPLQAADPVLTTTAETQGAVNATLAPEAMAAPEAATTVAGEVGATHEALTGTLGTDIVATTMTEDLVAEELLTTMVLGF